MDWQILSWFPRFNVWFLGVNCWVWWHQCTLGMPCPVVMMLSIVWAWHSVTYLTPQDMSRTVSPSPLSHAAPTCSHQWVKTDNFVPLNKHFKVSPYWNLGNRKWNVLNWINFGILYHSALASWHYGASNCAGSPYQELSYCAVSPTYLTPHTSHKISRIFPSIGLNFYCWILVIHENPNTRNTQWSFPPSGRQ